MPLIENRDIIVVGQQAWDVPIGSNCKDIALEFSRHNRVLYVNAALDRRSRWQQKNTDEVKKRLEVIKGQKAGLEKLNDNLYVYYPDVLIESINFLPWPFLFRYLNKINNRRLARSLQKPLQELQFKDFILFNDSDMFRSFHLKELLQPRLSIYYSRDNLLATPYWGRHGSYMEPRLIAQSDACVANSEYLANYCRSYNPNSHYVGQGCDLSAFKDSDELQIPEKLAAIQKPILGYVGALLSLRLDEAILLHLAETKPNWNIVLVGPEDEQFKRSRLHQLENVYFLGPQKPETLAAYIKGFDICLNPQAINPLTIGNYPRKIDEYLAMGKPTIATRTQAIGIFAQHIYIADHKEDYVRLAEIALAEDNNTKRAERIAFAQSHSWQKNVEEIYKVMANSEAATSA